MAIINNRRSAMVLFSDATCPYSHRVRMVLSEKGIVFELVDVDPENLPEDLIDLNPYQTVPTLVDRDLVLYDAGVIMEYLDERFPHPPLMPVDPVSRAQCRLFIHRIQNDWYTLLDEIEQGTEKAATKAKKELRESLISSAEIFQLKPFFLSDEFTLVDCMVAPVLWRLPKLGIDLPGTAKSVIEYSERIFERSGFRDSLTDKEREMRD